jgi:hypothetical protein
MSQENSILPQQNKGTGSNKPGELRGGRVMNRSSTMMTTSSVITGMGANEQIPLMDRIRLGPISKYSRYSKDINRIFTNY